MPLIFSLGMGPLENLMRSLSKIMDDPNSGQSFHGIIDCIQVFRALVRKMMEDVHGFDSRLALLLATEHEVNPMV